MSQDPRRMRPSSTQGSLMAKRAINLTPKQALRDLEWVLTSPSLVTDPQAVNAIEFDRERLDVRVQNELTKFCKQAVEHKVGRYFEDLIGFWLQHIRRVELVGKGIQVRDENRTVGEIDFLFRDEQGVLTHLEVAAKFFLHFPGASARVSDSKVSHFPGPNASDNFERKAEKLFNDQLGLSIDRYPEVEQRLAFIRGTIFYHPSNAHSVEFPPRLSATHGKGVWIRESELESLDSMAGGFIASKPFWFSPFSTLCQSKSIIELKDELSAHFARDGYPVMVCLLNAEDDLMPQRFFVVSDSWPNSI